MRSKPVGLWVVASLLALGGCDNPGTTSVETDRGIMLESLSGSMVPVGVMRHDLDQITREIALGLDDPAVRQMLFEALHASPYPEHKLHLGTFLRQRGAILGAAMATARGQAVTVADVLATLDGIIDLEFYMPVKDHFADWRGNGNVIVASALADDGSIPVAFDLAGRAVSLESAEQPPQTPTLAVVFVEADFSKEPAVPTASAAALLSSGALYMTQTSGIDDHEGFLHGAPELEMHVFVKNAAGTFVDLQCAGNGQAIPFKYNQDNASWTGNVKLIEEAALISKPFDVEMWEHDGTGHSECTAAAGRPPTTDNGTKTDFDNWGSRTILQVASDTVISATTTTVPVALNTTNNIQKDDEVGVVYGGPVAGCWMPTGPMKFQLRMSDSGHPSAGYAWLDFQFGTRSPICTSFPVTINGPTEMDSGAFCNWSSSVSVGTPPYSYVWKIGSQTVSTSAGYSGSHTSSFTLDLTVTDANMINGTDIHSVTVNPGFGLACD